MAATQDFPCVFMFDVVCPYAYIASHMIDDIEKECNIKVLWQPVCLGGLYKSTDAPQGTNSATSIQNKTKLRVTTNDFLLCLYRSNINLNYPPAELRTPKQKQPTLKVMRILTAVPAYARSVYAKAFYKARWIDNIDLTDEREIESIVHSVTLYPWSSFDLSSISKVLSDDSIKNELTKQTDIAASNGVFGVPSFWVNGRLYWGVDRIHFVKRELGSHNASPPRLQLKPKLHLRNPVHVRFYFDYSSPWSYLGSTQIEKKLSETNVSVNLEFFPILLGALFKNIGTPNLPAAAMSQAKLDYSRKDFDDWVQFHNVDFIFSPHFPLRTVLPLRVTLAAKKLYPNRVSELIHKLYRATWAEETNICDPSTLEDLLNQWNYSASALLEAASTHAIKQELISNTQIAQQNGCCGVPSFQVSDSPVIWGQDRLHIVQDLVCGWDLPPHINTNKASL